MGFCMHLAPAGRNRCVIEYEKKAGRHLHVILLIEGSHFTILLEGDTTICYLNWLLAMHMELVLNMSIER